MARDPHLIQRQQRLLVVRYRPLKEETSMKWAMLDSAGRPSGFYHPDVHPELFEQVGEEFRPRGPIAAAVPVSEEHWQDLVSHPGRRRIENGRVIATEPPPPTPDAQSEADRALLREAMLRDQLEAWIEHRAAAPQGLSPPPAPPRRRQPMKPSSTAMAVGCSSPPAPAPAPPSATATARASARAPRPPPPCRATPATSSSAP